ncbi:MAG: UDP-N-acetylglucosamine 1-carboxyvinyltransferase [Candidatus Uhrbacteria bacterium]|nr:UDP-N-acetylglucosamine 1-carboxyvinyltransferase [Candidatus Uhrbacteria bacterium]
MPSTLKITGGKPLSGRVTISGAKNAASKMIIGSLLTADEVTLRNVPLQQESDIARELVTTLGATSSLADHTLKLQVATIATTSAMQLSRKNRLAILALAPLLHRAGEAFVPTLGGDKIGPRPVNFHLDTLEAMGATIEADAEGYRASVKGKLKGALIDLPYPSVGATETALFAGVLAQGRTVIRNAAIEPEIIELIMMLQKMGAIIEMGAGRHIEIIGVEKLHGCDHTVLPDRMEAASFGSLALATRGEIFCEGASHRDMVTFLNAVRLVGGDYEVHDDGILFRGASSYRGIQLETDTHPGFMTDWQQPFLVALTQAEGTSVMHETVYQERFAYTDVLNSMGADISLFDNCLGEVACRFKDQNYKHSAVIKGPAHLKATDMVVPDIRAGLAYVIAALVAEGTSTLTGVEHLERGYEDLYGKLTSVGAELLVT